MLCGSSGCTTVAENGTQADLGLEVRKARIRNVDPTSLKLSDTVRNHLDDLTRGGASARPYIDSPLTIGEIIQASDPVLDPGGLPGGLRWDVAGAFNGSEGVWELVIDTETNTVVHYLFRSK
jgi:hypothetical protein